MEGRPGQPIALSQIELKGGGRLDGVSHVVDVRVEAGPVRWQRSGPGALEVEGEVRAYIYYFEKGRFEKGRRGVSGHGLRIPFASRLDLPEDAPDRVDVYVDELRSEYDYDPVSEEFQHTIEVTLAVAAAGRAQKGAEKSAAPPVGGPRPVRVPRERSPAGSPAAPREASPSGAPEAPAPNTAPPEPPTDAAGAREEGKTLVWKAFPPPIAK